ncbi:hypothetical protein [Bradyrhizobium sp. 141]|uniref:hypothetical protein n=1 Tax=Bradyrhizobium sp. 141 TaxID=2782617 RepID=UPI001FF79200|nr:hypothetical protein [Bradyrhizobium sp. 141]
MKTNRDAKAGKLGVRNAVKTARNKINEFVREVVKDQNVDPSHGWRHRFKTVGIDQASRCACWTLFRGRRLAVSRRVTET